jgi:hypothetical protein
MYIKLQKGSASEKPFLRIRSRIHFGLLDPDWEYGYGSRRAKITHKSEENSSFELLDVFF